MHRCPLSDGIEERKPLVSYFLLAYNQSSFIKEAVESAFSQTHSPLQIILSDDSSTDTTYEIMQDLVSHYSGPHEVILNRNKKNLGIADHINRLVELSSGELIILAAGDDISMPERTSVLAQAWLESGREIKSLHSDVITIDECSKNIGAISRGYHDDYIQVINDDEYVLGCSHAVDRDIFKLFEKMSSDVVNEDKVLPFRALMLGRVVGLSHSLVKYRVCRSEWKKGYGFDANKTTQKKEIARYKNGVLRISALKQMLKDVNTAKEFARNDVPIPCIEKAINRKIRENIFFINLIDYGFYSIVKCIVRQERLGFPELNAMKRYLRLEKRNASCG